MILIWLRLFFFLLQSEETLRFEEEYALMAQIQNEKTTGERFVEESIRLIAITVEEKKSFVSSAVGDAYSLLGNPLIQNRLPDWRGSIASSTRCKKEQPNNASNSIAISPFFCELSGPIHQNISMIGNLKVDVAQIKPPLGESKLEIFATGEMTGNEITVSGNIEIFCVGSITIKTVTCELGASFALRSLDKIQIETQRGCGQIVLEAQLKEKPQQLAKVLPLRAPLIYGIHPYNSIF